MLRAPHAVRYARLLTARAHEADLAVAQKNWVELGERGPRIGFDFAVAEECGRWRECAGYPLLRSCQATLTWLTMPSMLDI